MFLSLSVCLLDVVSVFSFFIIVPFLLASYIGQYCCLYNKWFKPRCNIWTCGLIVLVRVVPRKTLVGRSDRRFDNLSGSHHQNQVMSICQSSGNKSCSCKLIGQFSRDLSAIRLEWRNRSRLVSLDPLVMLSFCSVRRFMV